MIRIKRYTKKGLIGISLATIALATIALTMTGCMDNKESVTDSIKNMDSQNNSVNGLEVVKIADKDEPSHIGKSTKKHPLTLNQGDYVLEYKMTLDNDFTKLTEKLDEESIRTKGSMSKREKQVLKGEALKVIKKAIGLKDEYKMTETQENHIYAVVMYCNIAIEYSNGAISQSELHNKHKDKLKEEVTLYNKIVNNSKLSSGGY